MATKLKDLPVRKAAPLTKEDKQIIRRVLKAAGVERVTRAMTKTCPAKKYTNNGWDNCFFTQMLGGKAKLDSGYEAWIQARQADGHLYDNTTTVYVAHALGGDVTDRDVGRIIGLFDSKTYYATNYDIQTNKDNPVAVQVGQVVPLLEFVMDWLEKKGVTFTNTVDAHFRPTFDN